MVEGPGGERDPLIRRVAAEADDVAKFLEVHPETPQRRFIDEAARLLRAGGVIVYPTDTTYALGARIGEKEPLNRICRIRRIDERHDFTLCCRDLSESGTYARFGTPVYRLLRSLTPGPYTFLLRAAKEVPRRLQHPKKKTIGLRVPDHNIVQALLEEMGEPIFTTTLRMPGEELPLTEAWQIRERLDHEVDLVLDGGPCGFDTTTVIDLTDEDAPEVVRRGLGEVDSFF